MGQVRQIASTPSTTSAVTEPPAEPAPRDFAARIFSAGSRRHLPRLVGAVLAGVATGLAFPPTGWVWLAPVGAAALTLLCRGIRPRTAALLGLLFGLGFFLVLLRWLTVVGVDGMVVVSVVEALFLAALGAALAVVTSLRGWPVWASALWILVEFLRSSVPFGGFAWGKLAFALNDTPFVTYAAFGGAPLVGFLAVLAANLLGWAIVTTAAARIRLLAVAGAGALTGAGLVLPLPIDSDGEVTAAVVQGNIPGRGLEFLGRARTVTRFHLEATEQLMADVEAGAVERPDFVLWPENSTDLSPFTDEPTAEMVQRASDLVGMPLLVGSMQNGPDPETQVRNTPILYEPGEEPRQVYQKRHPVPFGEYIPFREFFSSFIDRLALVPRDQVPGDEPGVFEFGPATAGIVICFEVAWDGLVRDAAAEGTEVLLVQTNNATYLGTGQLEQQFATTRLRAIEHGITVLIASTSGISAIIAPDGEIIEKSGEMTREIFVERVPMRAEPTIATVVGAWPERVIGAAGLVALGFAMWYRRRDARTTEGSEVAATEPA